MNLPRARLVAGALVLTLVAVPVLLPNYWVHVLTITLMWAQIASSWNVAAGMTGLLSLGHGLFVGAGAYTSTSLFLHLGLSPWLGMVAGIAVAVVIALAIGYLSFRYALAGLTFGFATLAFAHIALLLVSSTPWLGGIHGLTVQPQGTSLLAFQFEDRIAYYYVMLALLSGTLAITWWVSRSRAGFYFRAIRENEEAAAAIGISPTRWKLLAIMLSAALAAPAGSFYAQYVMYIDPRTVLGVSISIEAILFTAIGGMGTLLGPLVGAAILVPLGEVLRVAFSGRFANAHLLLYAIVLITVILTVPGGIVGDVRGRWMRREARRVAASPPTPPGRADTEA
ncbi:MAG: branched-chain amino acid ABC transporter permease [Candidatus Limnocylindrales bacterium]